MSLFTRFATVLLLPLALSACWVSNDNLVPASARATPEVEGYWLKKVTSGQREMTLYEVKREGTLFRTFQQNAESGDWTADKTFTFVPVKDRYYLVASDQNDMTNYVIMYVGRDMITQYDPICRQAIAQLPGVRKDKEQCNFADYATLMSAARDEVEWIQEGNVAVSRTTTYRRQ